MTRRTRTEAGESLLEIVVSVAILGLGVVALLGGLATAVAGSSLHRDQANVSAVLTAAGERVKFAPYKKCAKDTDYLIPFTYEGWTGPAPQFSVADWDGGTYVIRDWTKVTPPRPCDQYDDLGFHQQLVTLTVATSDGRVKKTLSVVKRFRDCAAAASGACN